MSDPEVMFDFITAIQEHLESTHTVTVHVYQKKVLPSEHIFFLFLFKEAFFERSSELK